MDCRNCGKTSHRIKTVFTTDGPKDKCTNCGLLNTSETFLPDVAYPYGSGEYTEENIAYPHGHPKQGEPIPFSSRKGKAEAMKIAKVRESGDRKHGAINCAKPKRIYST